MSTTIVRAGRARFNDGYFHLEIAAHDNNVRPYPPRSFGKSDRDFHSMTGHHKIEDVEKLADYVEGLAREYDGGCLVERGKRYSGAAAYNLWAARIKKGTGRVIRKPRLSEVLYHSVPGDISGSATKGVPSLAKGDKIDVDTAMKLVGAGVKFMATCDQGDGYTPFKARVGFILDGTLYYYLKRSHRRGYSLPSRTTFTLLQGIDGSASKFGDLIPQIEEPQLATYEQIRLSVRDDVFVLMTEGEDPKILQGRPRHHSLEKIGPARYGETTPPSLYDRANAEALLARLRMHLPEVTWRVVSLREHTMMLLEDALTR